MALHLVNQGRGLALANFLNKTAPQTWVLKLYKNDQTPGDADTEANYTEATFTGYSAKTLTAASWTVTDGNPGTATFAQQTFASTADQALQIIYGAFIIQTTSGKLLAAERFSVPQNITRNGETIQLTPAISDI